MIIKDTKELLDILTTIKFCDIDEAKKIKAIDLAIKIIEEWSNYLDFVGKRNAIEDAVDFIYDDGNINYNRLVELAKADKENCLIIFQPEYPIIQIYNPKDEDGLYTKTVTGVISQDEYEKVEKV